MTIATWYALQIQTVAQCAILSDAANSRQPRSKTCITLSAPGMKGRATTKGAPALAHLLSPALTRPCFNCIESIPPPGTQIQSVADCYESLAAAPHCSCPSRACASPAGISAAAESHERNSRAIPCTSGKTSGYEQHISCAAYAFPYVNPSMLATMNRGPQYVQAAYASGPAISAPRSRQPGMLPAATVGRPSMPCSPPSPPTYSDARQMQHSGVRDWCANCRRRIPGTENCRPEELEAIRQAHRCGAKATRGKGKHVHVPRNPAAS